MAVKPTRSSTARADLDFGLGSGDRSVAWRTPGAYICGTVAHVHQFQAKKFGSDELKFYDDGNPVMSRAITLCVIEGDTVDSADKKFEAGDICVMYVESAGDKRALRDALAAFGATPKVGVVLTAQYVKDNGKAKVKSFEFVDDASAEEIEAAKREHAIRAARSDNNGKDDVR